jgi:hypothetical protein
MSLIDHYLALSYVWGQIKTSRKDILVGNKVIIEKLPQVIQDAVVATKKLNERYLRVDLVSVDQDGPHDIQQQVTRMDLIYRLADITLVAATAKVANCSLPGIQNLVPSKIIFHRLMVVEYTTACR